jgi:hypothetical protein
VGNRSLGGRVAGASDGTRCPAPVIRSPLRRPRAVAGVWQVRTPWRCPDLRSGRICLASVIGRHQSPLGPTKYALANGTSTKRWRWYRQEEGVMRIHGLLAVGVIAISLSPSPAPAEDSGACMQDALSICSQFIPDRERVAACLMSNHHRISVACRNALSHYNPKTGAS